MITAIVQARVGSLRLENKMLMDLHGYKIIEWVLYRILKCTKVEKFVLAIPDTVENNILEEYGKQYNFVVYRGNEKDVLSRFYYAALENEATQIVRICADNPLIAASEVDRLIDFYIKNSFDYAYNHIPKGNAYPDGLGAEIVRFEILKYIYENSSSPQQREHVFNFIWDNIGKFKVGTINPNKKSLHHPELKFDIDTLSDYNRLKGLPIVRDMIAEDIVNVALLYMKIW